MLRALRLYRCLRDASRPASVEARPHACRSSARAAGDARASWRSRTASWVATASVLALALASAACRTPLPPDPDADPSTAMDLQAPAKRSDKLECAANDCVDWYRLRTEQAGTLRVRLRPLGLGIPAGTAIALQLLDHRAQALRSGRDDRGSSVIEAQVPAGIYFVRVSSEWKDRLIYDLETELIAQVTPPPAPPSVSRPTPKPPPRVTRQPDPPSSVVAGRIVEVEGRPGAIEQVLFTTNPPTNLRPGLRGRLRKGDATLAEVEVVEAYQGGGARARLKSQPTAPIDASTVIEIDVPAGLRAP